ncbi:MAG: S9 family peptidase [Woeseiaceae bacterium]|nr:S9 family peptidase [Woeseiaceae bacterium]
MRFLLFTILVVLAPCRIVAAPTADAFGTLPTVYDAAISPDGSQIAIIMNIQGEFGVRIVTLGKKGEKIRAALLGAGVKPSWIKWANDERVLVGLWESRKYRSTPYTVSFIYTLDASSMSGKILVENKDMLRQDNADVVDFLEDDPDHILMAFSDVNQFQVDINRVKVSTGRYTKIERTKKHVQQWYTDSRGEPRVGQGLIDRPGATEREWNLIIRDADEDRWRKAEDYPGLEAGMRIFGFTDNPNELVIGDRAGRDTLGLYVYNLVDKAISRELFHHDTYDARGLVVSGNGSIIGASFVADTTETELFGEYDTVLSRMRNKFSDYTVDYVDQSADGRLVLFKISNAYDPGGLAIVDASTDEVTILAYMRPELPTEEMGLVSNVSYPARDGYEIPAYMTLPLSVTSAADIRNLPFVILPHGGPYARTAKRFDYFAQYFASRGFAVLQMNFRGSAGYGKGFEDAGRENWVKMQDDVEDGTKWIIEKGLADPDRICIAGWSYGGYAALIGAIKAPELYACAISMAGVTDLKDMINDIKKYKFGSITAQNFILRGFDSKQAIAENSPVNRAAELKVPLFLAHGKADQRVHFDQFSRMKRALRKSSAPVTYMEFDDEDHFLSDQSNRQAFFRGLDEFLRDFIGERAAAH